MFVSLGRTQCSVPMPGDTPCVQVTQRQIATVAQGGVVDGSVVRPLGVGPAGDSKDNRLRVVITEGRNREVRQLCAGAGIDAAGLKRIRIGGYKMARELGVGQYR